MAAKVIFLDLFFPALNGAGKNKSLNPYETDENGQARGISNNEKQYESYSSLDFSFPWI